MAESFYTSTASGAPNSPFPQSSSFSANSSGGGPPPPPPPKPQGQSYSQNASADPSRTGTPIGTTPSSLGSKPAPPVPSRPSSMYQVSSPPPPPPPPLPPPPSSYHEQQQPQSSSYAQPQNQSAYQHQSQTQQQHPQQHQQSSFNTSASPPPLSQPYLPQTLLSKSTAELQPVLSNPSLITALAQQHPSYAASNAQLQSTISSNLALAQEVANLEARLSAERDQTAQLMLNHTSLQTQWRRKQREMDDALAPWGPKVMYQRLSSSINEQEALLKAMQESFLDGGHNVDEYYDDNSSKASDKEVMEWIKRIREGTTLLEKRREMRARWDEGRVGGWR